MFLPAKLTDPALGFISPPRHFMRVDFLGTRGPTTAMASPAFMSMCRPAQRYDVAVFGFGFVNVVEAVSVQNRIAHLHLPLQHAGQVRLQRPSRRHQQRHHDRSKDRQGHQNDLGPRVNERLLDGGGGATEDLEDETEDVKETVEREGQTDAQNDTQHHRNHHDGEDFKQHETNDLVGRCLDGLQDGEFLLALAQHEGEEDEASGGHGGDAGHHELSERQPGVPEISPPLRSTSLWVLDQSTTDETRASAETCEASDSRASPSTLSTRTIQVVEL